MKTSFLKTFLLFLVSACLIASCKKDEQEHPQVKTLEVTTLSAVRILATGEIVTKGSFKIFDHGFIYGSSSILDISTAQKVSLGSEVSEGRISKEISVAALQYPGNPVYVRSYLTNEKGTAYGDVVSTKMPLVNLTGLSPSSGKAGDLIGIFGNFSSLLQEEVSVKFGSTIARVTEVSPSKLTVEVPYGIVISSYSYNQIAVYVTVAGQALSTSYTFTITPTFKDFYPKSGIIGSTITITGDNVPSYYSSAYPKVYFGQTLMSASYNNGGLSVVIPTNWDQASFQISVEVNGIKTTLPGLFTVTPPTVSSISPATGLPGSTFTIFGSNFGYDYYNYATVTVGGSNVSFSYLSPTQIRATIPSNLAAGDYKVAVKVGPNSVEAPQTLKIQEIAISSFSPISGGVGKEITIQGTFNPTVPYLVYFGGTLYTSPNSVTATALRVSVPWATPPGNVKLSVKYGIQTAETSTDFTILAPSITSFSPTSGVAGTHVTISGVGFNANTYNNTVKFGTISANVVSSTETSITAVVPSNINPGAMKLTVISNGQTIVSTNNFTITN